MEDSANIRLRLLICIVLAIVTFAAFHQVLGHDFVNYDDDAYVYENEHVQDGLTLEGVKWAFSSVYAGTWQPMVWLSYSVDRQVLGPAAWGFHLTNLLIHIANVLLLFLVLQIMTGKPWRSAFVALLFGIHPLHVESVAWIAERKDVLSTSFWLLTMWAYVRYVRDRGVYRYLAVVLFFILGLMAKPMLVSLPFVLLLMDYWPLGRIPRERAKRARVVRGLVYEKLPLFALVCGSSVLTVIAQRAGGALAPADLFGLGVRVSNALVSYVSYMAKTVWPSGLAIPYIHPGYTLPIWQVAGSAIVLVLITALVLIHRRRYPVLAVGWLWYVITLVPVIGLVQIGWHGMADRFTYVPLIGLFMAIAWGVPEVCARLLRKTSPMASYIPVAAAICVAAVLFSVTTVQVGYWKNSFTLFEHTIDVTGDNAVAHGNLGTAYAQAKKYDKAVDHYRKAVLAQPGMAKFHSNLAGMLYVTKELDEAAEHYAEALRIDPGFPDARNNLDVVLAEIAAGGEPGSKRGKQDPRYQQALEHFNRGVEMGNQARIDEAVSEYREAIRIKPDFAEAHCNLGMVLSMKGEPESGIKACREALRLSPGLAAAHINLAVCLFSTGDFAGAWREVHLGRKYGGTPSPRFLEALAERMPEPPN